MGRNLIILLGNNRLGKLRKFYSRHSHSQGVRPHIASIHLGKTLQNIIGIDSLLQKLYSFSHKILNYCKQDTLHLWLFLLLGHHHNLENM